MITLGLHTGCIGGIFIRGIFGNFYTRRAGGEFLTFKTGIPGGLGTKLRVARYCQGKLFVRMSVCVCLSVRL